MKKTLFILFAIVIFNSCAAVYGPNVEKLVQQLQLGMTKQEVVNIMGKDYFVESVSQTPEGKVEILHFRSSYYVPYLVYFIDGRLSEYHRYIPPTPIQKEIRVVKDQSNNN